MLKMFSITCSEKLDIVNILGNPVRIAEWTRYGLPQDSFSTENAIIWENSDRWCLMIDPQMQAN
jgi:dynein heavy chain